MMPGGMFPGQAEYDKSKEFSVEFHPLSIEELSQRPPHLSGGATLVHLGLEARHVSYPCGACGQATNGRVVCSQKRQCDGAEILWCLCACEKSEPTVLVTKDGMNLTQLPLPREFSASSEWPSDLAQLYEEGARAYSAGAFTATSMVCRKILMACACHEGGGTVKDGESFTYYVDYIADNLAHPNAKTAIDAIRVIGNEANHRLQFVAQADAKRSLKIVQRLLDAIYALPAA